LVKSQSEQKEQPKGHNVADEQIDEDLILHCWNGVLQHVERVKTFNKSQGITNSDPWIGHTYDGWSEPMSVRSHRRWLNITRHKKSGKWITVDSLAASGRISDMEKDLFDTNKQWPRIELISMTRVRTQEGSGQEYLMRQMQAIGLSEIGAIVTLNLPDSDFTRKVPISPDTAKLPDGTDVKILRIGSGEFTYESSPKIYTTPFTKENVLATIDKYKPYEDGHGKVGYVFKKEGIANEVAVSSLEEFINANVDETIARSRQPAPQININSKDLETFVKLDRESRSAHEQYQ
jgi:hypothetical protein